MKALCCSPLLIMLLVGSFAARSAKIRLADCVNLKLLLVIGVLIGWQLTAIAQSGGWTSHQYYDHRYRAWWVQVSSTVPRAFTLTVNCSGVISVPGAVAESQLPPVVASVKFTAADPVLAMVSVWAVRMPAPACPVKDNDAGDTVTPLPPVPVVVTFNVTGTVWLTALAVNVMVPV